MHSKQTGRYTVPANEDYEPESDNEVLKNNLGIRSRVIMEALEQQELKRTELEMLEIFEDTHQFTAEDICNIHELWLGDIYPFAGRYRTVTMSKSSFSFAPGTRIAVLMEQLETEYLSKYTPCRYASADETAYALGIIHVELILIHPFREGNGRVARLLADLMVMQAKMSPLNFSSIGQTYNPAGFEQYILAIHSGLARNYVPIQNIFKELLINSN